MFLKVKPEIALKFTKLSVIMLGCWPPPLNATKKQLLLRDVYWWTTFVTTLFSVLVLINGIYEYRKDTSITIQTTCLLAGVCQMCTKMMVLRKHRWTLQTIIVEMENFVKRAEPSETKILQKYVDRCAAFHLMMTVSFYVICSGLVLGPVILPQPFPSFAKYPFKVESHPVYDIVYFQQAFIGVLAATGATVDCHVAVLLWFTSARFEILCIELRNVVFDEYDLNSCIRKHLHLISYANDVIKAVRFIILITVGMSALVVVFGAVQLIFAKSMTVKIQFVILVIGAAIQLFIPSRPAEELSRMSIAIGSAIYNSDWIGQPSKVIKSICIVIQRSQKPVKITVIAFIPELSLKYYASFLSSSFSYFTTIRAAVLH